MSKHDYDKWKKQDIKGEGILQKAKLYRTRKYINCCKGTINEKKGFTSRRKEGTSGNDENGNFYSNICDYKSSPNHAL